MPFTLAQMLIEISADDSPLIQSMRGIHNLAVFTGGAVGDALKLGFKGAQFAAGDAGRTIKDVFNLAAGAATKLANAVGQIMSKVATIGMTGALAALTYEIYQGATGAVHLQDVMSATKHVLGDSAQAVFDMADRMAAAFGIVKQESLEAALNFSLAFKEVTKTSEDASIIGQRLTEIAVDLRSFHGGTTEQAFRALESAVQGNFRSLKQYGIMINETILKEEAVRLGIAAKGATLDEVQKKQATYSVILARSKDMQGDLVRTEGEANNVWQKLTGTITNLATSIGTALLPSLTAIMDVGVTVFQDLTASFDANKGAFEGWGKTIKDWAETAKVVWRNFGDVWELAAVPIKAAVANIFNLFSVLPENLKTIGSWIQKEWVNMIKDGVNAVWTIFKNLGTNLKELANAIEKWFKDPTKGFQFKGTNLLEGFVPKTTALPQLKQGAFVDPEKMRQEVIDRIAGREKGRLEALQWGSDLSDYVTDVAKGGKEPEFKDVAVEKAADKWKSQTFGSADFWSHLQEQALGGGDTQAKQLAAQERTAVGVEAVRDELKKGLPARLAPG